MDAPIGTIISSMLEEKQFLSQPDVSKRWVLANGQSAIGSAYEKLSGHKNVPDLRGVFLRGSNADLPADQQNDRGNPENKKLGEYQSDELKSHSHKYDMANNDDAVHQGSHQDALYGIRRNAFDTTSVGGKETRPRNVTVNYFIRIN